MWVRPFHTCLVSICVMICCSTALDASMKEPSCDELRAMWRFSKRQSRAAEITNEIPTYRDPFAMNVWEEYARPRSAGRGGRYKKPPVYGTLVSGSGRGGMADSSPGRTLAFEEVMKLFGSPTVQWPGEGAPAPRRSTFRYGGRGGGYSHPHSAQSSFQHLKALIRNERARELQEQRMHEEEQAKIQYPPPRLNNDSPPTSMDGPLSRDKPSPQAKGVVSFPNMLQPSLKYMEDYIGAAQQGQKYRHKLPDTNTIMGGANPWAW